MVLIPGVLGSVLVDSSLNGQEARRQCETNLGMIGTLLEGSPLYPCDKRPETLWGDIGCLHWLFAPQVWERRMKSGNGRDLPGSVRATSLLDVNVRLRGASLTVQPYAGLLRALRAAGADVLVFPYDWRLSIRHNSLLLQRAILARWFGGAENRWVATVPEAERITFIGHSMGGILARYFLESPTRNGWLALRQLITIGTPHLGLPEAFLHLIGRTFPFPNNPFYRGARDAVVRQMDQTGVISSAGIIRPEFLPGRVQTGVLAFMASAFELLPYYDFVRNQGQPEPFSTSYRALVHTGTGTPAMDLVEVLHNRLQREHMLEQWLSRKPGRDYHFLGADGLQTAVAYERRGDRVITEPVGDGRVPIRSACPVAHSTAHVHVKKLAPGGLEHHRLCERADVQAYCLGLLRTGRNMTGRPSAPSVRTMTKPAPHVEDYVAATKMIMARSRTPARRGVVLSITRLEASSGHCLVDTATEPSNNPARCRLKNPPAHLAGRDVFEVDSPRLGALKYVLIQSNEGEGGYPVGGFLFLPAQYEQHVYIATFNVGPLDTRYRAKCKNGHHAELQLMRFVEHQPPIWRRSLRAISLANRSRSRVRRGYSPCNACCDDLAKFLTALNVLTSPSRVAAEISWLERYTGGVICGHPTDNKGLDLLRRSGWVLPNPRPARDPEITFGRRDLASIG